MDCLGQVAQIRLWLSLRKILRMQELSEQEIVRRDALKKLEEMGKPNNPVSADTLKHSDVEKMIEKAIKDKVTLKFVNKLYGKQ